MDFALTEDGNKDSGCYRVSVEVDLGGMPAEAVQVELYADPICGEAPERVTLIPMVTAQRSGERTKRTASYHCTFSTDRPSTDYTPRILPWHQDALVPLEVDRILWYR